MDNRYYNEVIAEMQPFLDENNFTNTDDVFTNDKKAFTVTYNNDKQMYVLSVADIEDGVIGEYHESSAWLFDDSQNAKDAIAVGIDFTSSLRKELGIKSARRSVNAANIDMPTASKGDSMDISGFAKKMLDVFPPLRDKYKEHIAVYGNFLYINFFGENLVPLLKDLFENGTQKQIKKFYEVLEDAYIKGNRDTVNICVAILCAAAKDNAKCEDAIKAMLSDNQHFLSSFNNFLPVFSKNKKLLEALVK